ncbi:uncharacterized protein LOC133517484 [Cydia pomonella]|uniref:uncharacterized protein LOC133517484 n=1 Tax=Cydia pomonella TaxID=82600 RepID=UPI002ADE1776|nr:uncharacterized protein LOC133517484 [Cydia pomonella]
MDVATAVQMNSRASSFTVEDICEAKQVLCKSLGIVGTYVSHRRGDETGKKTLEDIMKILRENEGRIPDFVATGILPSCDPDQVDVRCLSKEIMALRTTLAEVISMFEASLVTIAELRNEIINLRNAPTRSAASNFKNDNRPDTVCVESVSLRVADTVKCAARAAAPPARPPRVRPPPITKSRQRAYADVAGQPVAANRVNAPTKVYGTRAPVKEKSTPTDVDKEGFTLVERNRKARRAPRKTLCGTAEPVNSGLRVATPSKALYMSRLHYSAVADEVVEYVRRKTGYTLRVHQLQSRHYVHFSSFVVRVPRPLQDTIASADFWPNGVVFRRFRGNLPNPTPTCAPSSTRVRSWCAAFSCVQLVRLFYYTCAQLVRLYYTCAQLVHLYYTYAFP